MRQLCLDLQVALQGQDLQEQARHQVLLLEQDLQGVRGQEAEAIQQGQGAEVTAEARAEAGVGAKAGAGQDHLEETMTWNQPKLSRHVPSPQMPVRMRTMRLPLRL